MVKIDLHNHLRTGSGSGKNDFNRAANIASKRLGAGAIVGIDNYSNWKYEYFINIKGYERVFLEQNKSIVYVPQKDVYFIKGQEVPTKRGDILVLGIGKDIRLRERRPLEETLEEALDNGGVIVAVHPFYAEGTGDYLIKHPHLIGILDALEVHNGEASFGLPFGPVPLKANEKAAKFYENIKQDFPNLGALSSSDGHSIYELGSSWTEIEKPQNANFVGSLRKSVRKTNLETEMKTGKSIIGAMDHIMDIILLEKMRM